jgi:hypothetical protein
MLLVHGGPDSLRLRLHSRESVAMTAADASWAMFWFIVLVAILLAATKGDEE